MKFIITIIILMYTFTINAKMVEVLPYEIVNSNGVVDQSLAGYQGNKLEAMLQYSDFKYKVIPKWEKLDATKIKPNLYDNSLKSASVLAYHSFYNANINEWEPLDTLSIQISGSLFASVRVSYRDTGENETINELATIYKVTSKGERYCVADQVTVRMMLNGQYNRDSKHCLTKLVSVNRSLPLDEFSIRAENTMYSALSPYSILNYMSKRDAFCTLNYLGRSTKDLPHASKYAASDCNYTVELIDSTFIDEAILKGKVNG